MSVDWFKIGNTTYTVVARSTCRTCALPILLGRRLDVWVHENRIVTGTAFDHQARPTGRPVRVQPPRLVQTVQEGSVQKA